MFKTLQLLRLLKGNTYFWGIKLGISYGQKIIPIIHRDIFQQQIYIFIDNNMEKALLRALQGENIFPRPLWFMRQAGRYLPEYRALRKEAGSFLDLCFNPKLASEVTLQPLKRFPAIDGAILFSDILMTPLALGYHVEFVQGEGPKLEKVSLGFIKPWTESDFLKTLDPIFQTIRNVKRDISPEKTLIGFAGAPWTVATYMVEGGGSKDHAETKSQAFSNPRAFDELIHTLEESTLLYLDKQVEAGVEVLQLFDSWAGVLPEPYYTRWVVNPLQRIVATMHEKHPNIPVILFPKGNPSFYGKFYKDMTPRGLSLESTIDLDLVSQNMPLHITPQGGLDPQLLMCGGQEMLSRAEELLRAFSDRPYIFNLGHGMTPKIPVENVETLIKFVKEWRP